MRKNAFVAIAHIRELNLLKDQMVKRGEPLEKEDFKRALKSCGIPSNSLFLQTLKKAKQIQVIEGNLFVWSSKKPIHYNTLQSIYSTYQSKINEYSKNRANKLKEKKTEVDKRISDAISLLKENGYEIFVPYKSFFKKILTCISLTYKDSNIFGIIQIYYYLCLWNSLLLKVSLLCKQS